MILEPTKTEPTQPVMLASVQQLEPFFGGVGPTYIDFEATGLDMRTPDFRAVGIGIASSKCTDGVYASINNLDDYKWLVNELYKQNLVGYNIGYDAKVLHRMAMDVGVMPDHWPWVGDTMVLYKMVDNRGYTGQQWGLKHAQKEVLSWKETNEVELDQWLIDNGYSRTVKGVAKPLKGEMWRAPEDILGHYCGLDTVSTMQLDMYLHEVGVEYPEMMAIYEREFMTLANVLHEQFWHGLQLNKSGLTTYIDKLKEQIQIQAEFFTSASEATVYINEFNSAQHQELLDKEPPQFTKTGKVAARYTKWLQKVADSEAMNYFNPSSKTQLRWLFYERLYRLDNVKKKTNWKGEYITRYDNKSKKTWFFYEADVITNSDNTRAGTIEGKAVEDAEPTFSVDKNILPRLGLAGSYLFHYNKMVKELGYANAVLEGLDDRDRLPTSLRVHGTVTGRCSGGGYAGNSVNIQQQHKDPEYMACFIPPEGHKILQWDASALENVILAELSGDKNLFQLYGSGIPNDGHLFFGSRMEPLKEELTKYGYDPDNPTPEAIKLTKKMAKGFRSVAKVVVYLCSYGGGAGTLMKNLDVAGFSMPLKKCKELIKGYWDTIPEVTEYYKKLTAEWTANRGWLLNARSRPMSVPPKLKKDLPSRVIQSTGHDILLTVIYWIDRYRKERGVTMHPAIVDLHDETIWYVPDEQAEAAKRIIEDALATTNEEIGAAIPITGGVEICEDFKPFKCE